MEDELIEKMREYYCGRFDEEFIAITVKDEDYRARRITAYLNLLDRIVQRQMAELKSLPFEPGNELTKYFELLPDTSPLAVGFHEMLQMPDGSDKKALQLKLKRDMVVGSIDANILAKADNLNYGNDGSPLPPEFSDALAAFRGFALSTVNGAMVLSAGYNPRLYNYIEAFQDFFPDAAGKMRKQIILKVSDYRSALIQGKLLAKKGVWVSEFRIESGLNCGGHAFPTEGHLLGPILEEFKNKRQELYSELLVMCNAANIEKGRNSMPDNTPMRVTVQGGIGTANEDNFLMEYYQLDGTGWGSPFLLVPEATNVDDKALHLLATAQKDDYFLSHASPLGIPFHNFRKSTSEIQRQERVVKGRPGSPCYKKFLASDTEFTQFPICTASRQYQALKIKQLNDSDMPDEQKNRAIDKVMAKECLCEGLSASVFIKEGMPLSHKLTAVALCPGPNLAYFSGVFTLQQMVDHIYGRVSLLNDVPRPNMFINEARLYVAHLKNAVTGYCREQSVKQYKYLQGFRSNVMSGLSYYEQLCGKMKNETEQYIAKFQADLEDMKHELLANLIPEPGVALEFAAV